MSRIAHGSRVRSLVSMFLLSSAVLAAPALKNTAVQLHAGANVTEAEVSSVEAQKLTAQGRDLVAQALHTFKETPKPIWWRPTNFTPPAHVANAGPHGAGLDENTVAHK